MASAARPGDQGGHRASTGAPAPHGAPELVRCESQARGSTKGLDFFRGRADTYFGEALRE